MNLSEKISTWTGLLFSSIKGVVKMALSSRKPTLTKACEGGSVIILGNGPSLSQTISDYLPVLQSHPTMAVNFAANAEEFTLLKPRFYLLADPHFFDSDNGDPNVTRLMRRFDEAVDWEMTLFLPMSCRGSRIAQKNPHVRGEYYNALGVEGFQWLENLAFSSGRGMPRPRNVLIPSIMVSTLLGYDKIYIVGADHSWTRTLSVNDRNEVISVQKHFYQDGADELERVKTEYLKYPLHRIMYSFYVAFKSYFTIQRYAAAKGISIFNATPGSFIDAFPRRSLDDLAAGEQK